MRIARPAIAAILVIAAIALLPSGAHAQTFSPDPTQVVKNLTSSGNFIQTGKDWATSILGGLLLIEFIFIGIQHGLFKNDASEFLGSVAFRVLTACVILWVINNADTFLFGIVDGFKHAGQQLGGTSDSTVFTVIAGFAIALMALAGACGAGQDMDYTLAGFTGFFALGNGNAGFPSAHAGQHTDIIIALQFLELLLVMSAAVILLQYVLITIESYLVIFGGIVFLGFAGTKYTMPFAQGYLSYAVNVGAKLFTFYLVLAVEKGLIGQLLVDAAAAAVIAGGSFSAAIGLGDIQVGVAVIACGQAAILAGLAWYIPNIAGSFLSGSSSISASSMLGNISGMMASAATRAAASAQAGQAAKGEHALQQKGETLAAGGHHPGHGAGAGGSAGHPIDATMGSAPATPLGQAAMGEGANAAPSVSVSGGNSTAFTGIVGGGIKRAGANGNGTSQGVAPLSGGRGAALSPGGGAALSPGGSGASAPLAAGDNGVGAGSDGVGGFAPNSLGNRSLSSANSGSLAAGFASQQLLSGAGPAGLVGGGGGRNGGAGASASGDGRGLSHMSSGEHAALSDAQAVAAFDATSDAELTPDSLSNLSPSAQQAIREHIDEGIADARIRELSDQAASLQALRSAVPTGEAPPSAVQVRFMQ